MQTNGTEHAVQTAIAHAQERLTVYEDRLNAGASAAVAREALAGLDPLWDELFPAEQARIVQPLLERDDIGTAR